MKEHEGDAVHSDEPAVIEYVVVHLPYFFFFKSRVTDTDACDTAYWPVRAGSNRCWRAHVRCSLENLVRNLSPSDAALFKRCYAVLQQSLAVPAADSEGAAPAFALPKCITSAILGGKARGRVLDAAAGELVGAEFDEEDDEDDEDDEVAAKGKGRGKGKASAKRKQRPSLKVDTLSRMPNRKFDLPVLGHVQIPAAVFQQFAPSGQERRQAQAATLAAGS